MSDSGSARAPAPPGTGLYRLGSWLWTALVLLVVLLALYTSLGRYTMGRIGDTREWLVEALNARLPFPVQVERIAGAWNAFSPGLRFEGLQLGAGAAPVHVAAGHLRLDIPGSIASGSLQLSRLELSGVSLQARLTPEGALELEGFEAGSGLQDWLREFLPQVERVSLREHLLRVRTESGEQNFRADLSLERVGNTRRLQARVANDYLHLALHADGVGNPLRPLSWSGDVFLDAASDDLAQLRPLWESLKWPFRLRGAAKAQFWLNRSGGDSSAQLRMSAGSMLIEEPGGAWALPLDQLYFDAALQQQGKRWTLLTEGLHAEREDRVLDLARAQFDWQGRSLRIRGQDLQLGSLPTLLSAAPGLPQPLRELLPELAPSGRLQAVDLRFDDLAAPASSWSLRGSLDAMSVRSWRGAPGLTGVSGFLELAPGEGRLRLDADAFSMYFPTVYREPLAYERARGDIALGWDSTALWLDSGLMEVSGSEGTGRGRFSLNIPFEQTVTGPEMHLLVGLEDSSLQYGDKYLPYRLPAPLLDWLEDSVGDGDLPQAAFIWRGSLRGGNFPHLSIQLFLDVADADLRFDPSWPVLRELDARLWLDNNLTLARASDGRIYDTRLSDLAVRVYAEEGSTALAISSALNGDAGDGHRLLRESPLADYTANTFAGWRMAGPVAGTLALNLDLGKGAGPPDVSLDLQLQGAEADATALALPLRDVTGSLRYRSGNGFVGSRLRGRLWDAPISAQANAAEPAALEVALEGQVDGQSVASWLALPQLAFAQGQSAVSGSLTLSPESGALLQVSSDLVGMALDAPRPFGKPAGRRLPLQLRLPFGGDPRLELALGERLDLRLDFTGGEFTQLAAGVGAAVAPAEDCDARYCLKGTLSRLDLLEWQAFAARYLKLSLDAAEPGDTAEADPLSGQSYRIDSLAVGDLRAGERRFGAARLDLWGLNDHWQGALEASWAQGSLTRDDERLQLLIEYLDTTRFEGGGTLQLAQLRRLLPAMRVDILELRRDSEIIGELGFDLENAALDSGLFAAGIKGTLFGVDLAPEQPGLLAWTGSGDEEYSALELDLAFEDLEAVLERAGFPPTLEARRGSAALRLRWPGNPLDYQAERARGALRLQLRDGRVRESRPGALALVSLLNLAEILRSLSLSHMFETGIPFELASTDLRLHAGTVEVADLHIDGAASAFAFTGQSSLIDGAIEGELVVTLPVANNLPWVAALAGGPAVAAGVFVVSKVFEKQVKRMSSAVYSVSGNIDNPQVSFRRLFDDRPNAPLSLQEPDREIPEAETAAGSLESDAAEQR